MGQVGGGLRFSPEPLYEGFVIGELGVEHLDCHLAAKQGVLAEIDIGHTASSQVRREVITVSKGVWVVHRELGQILEINGLTTR